MKNAALRVSILSIVHKLLFIEIQLERIDLEQYDDDLAALSEILDNAISRPESPIHLSDIEEYINRYKQSMLEFRTENPF